MSFFKKVNLAKIQRYRPNAIATKNSENCHTAVDIGLYINAKKTEFRFFCVETPF